MAFGAALIAQGAGQAQGKIQAYKDQVAQQADMARLAQQQAQFDATQKEQSREFDAQQQIRTAQEGRAATDATRTDDQWKPADPKTGFPGGYLWQKAQQDIKSGNVANTSATLTNTGKALANKAQDLQNQWAPIMDNLQYVTGQQNLANNAGNDQASQQQRALALQTHATELQKGLYDYKAKIDSSVAADPASVAKEYDAANASAQKAFAALNEKLPDALGHPNAIPLVSDTLRAGIPSLVQQIKNSADPMEAADQAVSLLVQKAQADKSFDPHGGVAAVAQYLAETARAAYIQHKMVGSKGPAPASPAAPVPPAPNGWAAPGSPNFMQPPGPFGSTVGGSNAAAPFGQ